MWPSRSRFRDGRLQFWQAKQAESGTSMEFNILIHPEATGGYSVSVPDMPGCHSQGETLEEAMANNREAAELWLEVQTDRMTPP